MNIRIFFLCSIFFLTITYAFAENNFAFRPFQKQMGSNIFKQRDVQKAISQFCKILLIDPKNKTAQENFKQIAAFPALTAQQRAQVFLLEDLLGYIENLNKRIVYLISKRDLLKNRLVKSGFDKVILFEGLLDIKSSMFQSQKFLFHSRKPVLSQNDPLGFVSQLLLDEKEQLIAHIQYLQRQYYWLKTITEDRRHSPLQKFVEPVRITASRLPQNIVKRESWAQSVAVQKENKESIEGEDFKESKEVPGFSYVPLDHLKDHFKQKDDKINELSDQVVDLSLKMSEIEIAFNEKIKVIDLLKKELVDIQQRFMLEKRIIQEKDMEIQSLQNSLRRFQSGLISQNDDVSFLRDEQLTELTGILEIYKHKLVEKDKVAKEKTQALIKTQNDLLDLNNQISAVQDELLKLKSHSRRDELQDDEINEKVEELQTKFQDIQHFLLENLPDSDKISTHLVTQEF